MITDKNSGKRDIGIKIISALICLIVVSFPLSKAADKICYPYVKAKAVAYLCKKYDAKITDFKLIDSRHAGTYWDSSRDELFQFLAWKDFAFEFEYNGRKFFVNRNDGKFYDDYQLEDIENWCTEWLQKNIDENIVGIELIIDNYFNYIANCDKSNNYVLTKSDTKEFLDNYSYGKYNYYQTIFYYNNYDHSNELEYTKQLKAKIKDKIKISDYIHISNSPYPKLFILQTKQLKDGVHIIILLKIIIEEIYNENKNLYSFNFNNYDNECCHIFNLLLSIQIIFCNIIQYINFLLRKLQFGVANAI